MLFIFLVAYSLFVSLGKRHTFISFIVGIVGGFCGYVLSGFVLIEYLGFARFSGEWELLSFIGMAFAVHGSMDAGNSILDWLIADIKSDIAEGFVFLEKLPSAIAFCGNQLFLGCRGLYNLWKNRGDGDRVSDDYFAHDGDRYSNGGNQNQTHRNDNRIGNKGQEDFVAEFKREVAERQKNVQDEKEKNRIRVMNAAKKAMDAAKLMQIERQQNAKKEKENPQEIVFNPDRSTQSSAPKPVNKSQPKRRISPVQEQLGWQERTTQRYGGKVTNTPRVYETKEDMMHDEILSPRAKRKLEEEKKNTAPWLDGREHWPKTGLKKYEQYYLRADDKASTSDEIRMSKNSMKRLDVQHGVKLAS